MRHICHRDTIVALLTLATFTAVIPPTIAEDWPRYGHDSALTGRFPRRGAIDVPYVAWTLPLAGRELLVELRPASGEHRLLLNSDTAVTSDALPLTPAGPRQLDLDGSGTLRPARETFHERWAKILPDVPGLQRVAWNHTWTDQQVCRLQLFAYDRGFDDPYRVWETDPPESVVFNPLNVVFDIDGDGVEEICVAAHYRVMIFEGTTGRKETELRYHSSRPYGWFGIADVDPDAEVELVTIGDFQSHIDVLDFDPNQPEADRLRVKWRRDIEQNIDQRRRWPQVGPRPLNDVTGDGRLEIVLNLFNDTGDDQWHAVALDAASGETVCDLPRRYVHGAADVDANGRAELFLATTDGVLVHDCGKIELMELREQRPIVRWSRKNACWCSTDVPCLGRTWSTTASQGMRQVLLSEGRRPVFFVKTWDDDDSPEVTLSAVQCQTDSQFETLWEIGKLPNAIDAIALEPKTDTDPATAQLRISLAANGAADLAGHNVRPRIVESRPLGSNVSMPIVARLCEGEGVSVIVEGPGEHIFAISPPRERRESPQLRWQRPGRGMRDGSRAVGLLAADLDADGACEVIAADQAREGHALLVAYRGDGTTLWEKAFGQVPGAPPLWNVGALTFWWPGRFQRTGETDLLVNTRRGLMHSDVGHLIDGRGASTLWTRDKAILPGEFHWGWAGATMAIVDVTADGRDEIVCLHPVCFWIADGAKGEISVGRELASRKLLPAWAAYGEPMVHDFNDDGRPEILLDSPYILALLEPSGKVLWHGPARDDYPVKAGEGNVGETTKCKHALVDFDGDGRCEIASAGYGDGVRAIDPRTGDVLWSLTAPEPTGPRVTAANIDGHDGDEIIYPAGGTLVVITGDRTSGRVLWSWQGPAALSLPAIADVDADGLAEIVIQDANATIHCLDAVP